MYVLSRRPNAARYVFRSNGISGQPCLGVVVVGVSTAGVLAVGAAPACLLPCHYWYLKQINILINFVEFLVYLFQVCFTEGAEQRL